MTSRVHERSLIALPCCIAGKSFGMVSPRRSTAAGIRMWFSSFTAPRKARSKWKCGDDDHAGCALVKAKTPGFVCQACGAVQPKWSGRCDDCGAWNSLAEETRAAP